jgi:hypothetical protein
MDIKKAYQEKFEAQLREWKAKIEVLEAKAAKATAEAKIELIKEVEDLRRKKIALQAKFDELQHAGGEAWDTLKGGVEKAASELKSALERAISRFR